MHYFGLRDFQDWVLALFLGLVALVLVYMAWGSYPFRRAERSQEELKELLGHEIEAGLSPRSNPLAPFLWFIYGGLFLWAVAYIVYAAVRGQGVGY